MIKVKDVESKQTEAKRNITISGVSVINNELVDEDGNIANAILEKLPDGVNEFDIKISIILPSDED